MSDYEYQRTGSYFAIVAGSLERHATLELVELGAKVTREVPRGLSFSCERTTLYRILYGSRLVQRILAPLASFPCHSERYLYQQARSAINWPGLFPPDISFGIQSNVSNSSIKHSLYAGQVVKDAVCDSFRDKYGTRPDFTTREAGITFNLHIRENLATLSLDLSGQSMHKRGYRKAAGSAPLQETLAATMVRLSGWDGSKPLLDPMCGSGTILAEALMSYCKIPPTFLRPDTALKFLPDYDSAAYEQVRKDAENAMIELPAGLISGSDINPRNIEIARENLALLPFGERVALKTSRFQDLDRQSGRCVITNPPYGVRLESSEGTARLYNELGDFLKQKCPDSESYILCGDKTLVPELRLRAHWKKNLKNADLDVVLAKILVK